jgi:hypothetical protein
MDTDKPFLPTWVWVVLVVILVLGIAMVLFGLGSDESGGIFSS